MRFYNLIQSKEVRDYLEAGDRDPFIDSQIRYIMRAYDTLDNKLKYLEELKNWDGEDSITDYDIPSIECISDYYKKLLSNIYSNDPSRIRLFTTEDFDEGKFLFNKHLVEERFFDPYDSLFVSASQSFFSMEDLLEYYEPDIDQDINITISCKIFDSESKKQIGLYFIYMIGRNISLIKDFSSLFDDHDEITEMEEFINSFISIPSFYTDLINRKDPYYPYKDGTRVAIQLPIMDQPIYKYIYQDVDGNGTDYIYLTDEYKDSMEEVYDLGFEQFIFIPENRIQGFYNLYDWIKEA